MIPISNTDCIFGCKKSRLVNLLSFSIVMFVFMYIKSHHIITEHNIMLIVNIIFTDNKSQKMQTFTRPH